MLLATAVKNKCDIFIAKNKNENKKMKIVFISFFFGSASAFGNYEPIFPPNDIKKYLPLLLLDKYFLGWRHV